MIFTSRCSAGWQYCISDYGEYRCGDMLPTQSIKNDMLHRRVVNFDPEAAGYAAWFHQDRPAIGHILTFILPKSELPPPLVPKSKIYPNGGAFFRTPADDPDGLHGVLYNIKSHSEGHTHYEVNGLALSALGNRLLVNGGRLGPSVQAAPLNNTLTLDGENHHSKVGGGITEGFTTDHLDFATGDAGPALEGSSHQRSLLMVHSNKRAAGYFVVLDEVESKPGTAVKAYLHPANQTAITARIDRKRYEAVIDHQPSLPGISLSIFYGTTPDQVTIESIPSAVPRAYPGYPNHNRMESVYGIGSEGKRALYTFLYPRDASTSQVEFLQSEADGLRSTTVRQHAGTINDHWLEGSAHQRMKFRGMSMQANTVLVRESDGSMDFIFVRTGKFFEVDSMGFESDQPATVFMRKRNGVILSPGAVIRLTGAGIGSVQFDRSVELMDSGQDFLQVKLAPGTYRFARSSSP